MVPAMLRSAAGAGGAGWAERRQADLARAWRAVGQLTFDCFPSAGLRALLAHGDLSAKAAGNRGTKVVDGDAVIVCLARLIVVDERYRTIDDFLIAAAFTPQQRNGHCDGAHGILPAHA